MSRWGNINLKFGIMASIYKFENLKVVHCMETQINNYCFVDLTFDLFIENLVCPIRFLRYGCSSTCIHMLKAYLAFNVGPIRH